MPYTVTRQIQWHNGGAVVEVSSGGLDYANPDALVQKYEGEFQTFDDPVEAAETAIAICKVWRKDGAPRASVGYGGTGGITMPFDPCGYRELRKWAKKRYEQLPKCDRCGELLPKHPYIVFDDPDLGKFCREYCAEEAVGRSMSERIAADRGEATYREGETGHGV